MNFLISISKNFGVEEKKNTTQQLNFVQVHSCWGVDYVASSLRASL